MSDAKKHWAHMDEAGFVAGVWLLFRIHQWFGQLPFRVLLVIVMVPYFLLHGTARRASLDYLKHLSAYNPKIKANWWTSYRHFLSFGETLLDKILSYTGRYTLANVEFLNREPIAEVIKQGKGAVILASHLGNLELNKSMAEMRDVKINVLVHNAHNEKFNNVLKQLNPKSNLNLIQVANFGAAEAIVLSEKVANGEFVIIAADRIPIHNPSQNSCDVTFMGDRAPLPTGAYIMSHLLECPVFAIFCIKVNGTYQVRYEPFADRISLSRRTRQEQLAQYAQQYADRLAEHCQMAPLQWYNFYPFWHSSHHKT